MFLCGTAVAQKVACPSSYWKLTVSKCPWARHWIRNCSWWAGWLCARQDCVTVYFATSNSVWLHDHLAWNNTAPFPEIDRIQKGETKKEAEAYLDLFTTKNIKLKERVLIPVKQYPKVSRPLIFFFFSFVLFFLSHCEPSWFNLFCSRVSITQSHGATLSLKLLLSTSIFKLQSTITAYTGML